MDNFFRNLFGRREVGGMPTSDSKTETGTKANEVASGGGTFDERVVRVRNPQLALTVSAVYRAVELRAKTEAQFVVQYQKKDDKGNNFRSDLYGLGGDLNYLLQVEANPLATISSLIEQVVIRRLMYGNGFIYIERNNYGDPQALWLCNSGGYNPLTGTYTITYLSDYGEEVRMEAPRGDVLHFPNTFRDYNGFWGISTLQYAFDTLSLMKTEGGQALETAAKGGRVKLIVGEEKPANGIGTLAYGLMNKKQIDDYAKELNDKVYAQDVIGIRGLDKVQNISMTAKDMQMIELLNMGLDDVARFFGTPRPLLMLDTNSHYTTYTNATLEYLQRTVQPDVTLMEQEFQRKLLGRRDFGKRRIHFCEQSLLRLDKETQAKVDKAQLETGAATVNEIRQQYDRPSVENGNIIYISTNVAELGSEKLRGAFAKNLQEKNGTKQGQEPGGGNG